MVVLVLPLEKNAPPCADELPKKVLFTMVIRPVTLLIAPPKVVDEFSKKSAREMTKEPSDVGNARVLPMAPPPPAQTMPEVDALFSKSRRQGHAVDLTKWGQLGLPGDWAASPISLYGRNSASGTYGFFKDHALKNGDFKDQVKEQPGSASVVQGISEDRYGVSYSGIGYTTSGVRMVPLAAKAGQPHVEPTQANTKNGSYPLWRYLYIYVNQPPRKPLSPIVKEFLAYLYSREGQSDVLRDGYFPVDATLADKQLAKIR